MIWILNNPGQKWRFQSVSISFSGVWQDLQSTLWGDPVLRGHRCRHVVSRARRNATSVASCERLGQEMWVDSWWHVTARFILEAMAWSKDSGPGIGEKLPQIEGFSRRCIQNLSSKTSLCCKTESCGGSSGGYRRRFCNDPLGGSIDSWEAVGFPVGDWDLWAGHQWCFWADASYGNTGGLRDDPSSNVQCKIWVR